MSLGHLLVYVSGRLKNTNFEEIFVKHGLSGEDAMDLLKGRVMPSEHMLNAISVEIGVSADHLQRELNKVGG